MEKARATLARKRCVPARRLGKKTQLCNVVVVASSKERRAVQLRATDVATAAAGAESRGTLSIIADLEAKLAAEQQRFSSLRVTNEGLREDLFQARLRREFDLDNEDAKRATMP